FFSSLLLFLTSNPNTGFASFIHLPFSFVANSIKLTEQKQKETKPTPKSNSFSLPSSSPPLLQALFPLPLVLFKFT
ncbi:LOW QUALITY PROTEIN: hypothetical protein PanWU01x14_320940, partial [Parasponia andersonii]